VHQAGRPCGHTGRSRRARHGPFCRSPCTGPNDGAVNVVNVHGCCATDAGIPFPPARPHSSRCHASPLYSALHDGHTAARRFPHRTYVIPSSSLLEEYTGRTSPLLRSTRLVEPTSRTGRVQPRARFSASAWPASPTSVELSPGASTRAFSMAHADGGHGLHPPACSPGEAPLFPGTPAAGDHRGTTRQHKTNSCDSPRPSVSSLAPGSRRLLPFEGALRRGFRSPDRKR
jgi:hypothetical protein